MKNYKLDLVDEFSWTQFWSSHSNSLEVNLFDKWYTTAEDLSLKYLTQRKRLKKLGTLDPNTERIIDKLQRDDAKEEEINEQHRVYEVQQKLNKTLVELRFKRETWKTYFINPKEENEYTHSPFNLQFHDQNEIEAVYARI